MRPGEAFPFDAAASDLVEVGLRSPATLDVAGSCGDFHLWDDQPDPSPHLARRGVSQL